jgi:hypothetical protein
MQDLVNLAQDVELDAKARVSVQASVVNNNLPYSPVDPLSGTITTSAGLAKYLNQPGMQGEVIEYCIIQNAAMNITTGALMNYTLVNEVGINLAFWPKSTDAIANNLFRVGQNTKSYTKMAAESILDGLETKLGTTQISSPNRSDLVAEKLGRSQDASQSWYSQIKDFLRSHKALITEGVDAVSGFIPGGSYISRGVHGLLGKDKTSETHLVYIGSLRRHLEQRTILYQVQYEPVDALISEIENTCAELLELIKDMPDYFEVPNPVPVPLPVPSESHGFRNAAVRNKSFQ